MRENDNLANQEENQWADPEVCVATLREWLKSCKGTDPELRYNAGSARDPDWSELKQRNYDLVYMEDKKNEKQTEILKTMISQLDQGSKLQQSESSLSDLDRFLVQGGMGM